MRVAVVGTGYVGLVSGACLADAGHDVTCVDTDDAKVALIRRGHSPIYEAGLDELLRRHIGRGLSATVDLREAVLGSDVVLIAVGTPFDGTAIDLSYVRTVAREIGAALADSERYHAVVVKSTVVPGTTERVVLPLLEEASGKRAGRDFGVGMNPEFLTEGQAVADFAHPDRIVLGAIDARTMAVLDELYAAYPDAPRIRTNPSTAEMIKYASNALLATAISFSNEIASLCTAVGGVDVVDVMRGVHASSYLTAESDGGGRVVAGLASFVQAGCGYGGSCLPKDTKALVAQGSELGVPMHLLRSVIAVNEGQPRAVVDAIERGFTTLDGVRVSVLGLAFKPETSDVRESPAFPIIDLLREAGARVTVYDPVAIDPARRVLGDRVAYAHDLVSCLFGAQAAVLVTRWREFDSVPAILRDLGSDALVFDGRRQLDPGSVGRYLGVGR